MIGQDDVREQDDEDSKGSILMVGDLHFHGSELDAPPNAAVKRGRLEAHCLPVSRLNVLQVI